MNQCNRALLLQPDFQPARELRENLLTIERKPGYRDLVLLKKVLVWMKDANRELKALGVRTSELQPNVLKFTWNGSKWREHDPSRITGRIRIKSEKRGIFVDLGVERHGIAEGDILEVVRNGQRIGMLVVSNPDRYFSFARPMDDMPRAIFRVGDEVVLIGKRK